MNKHGILSRILSLLLVAAMLIPMVPSIGASAATLDADGYLGNVKLLDNGESITLPIKINNFAMDGMLFEYLSNIDSGKNSQYYLYEAGGAYQLFTLHLAGKKVGVKNDQEDMDETVASDSDAISGGVDQYHSLTSPRGTTNNENYLGVTSGGAQYQATLSPSTMTDGGGAKYLRLMQQHRSTTAASPRAWRKLTGFTTEKSISQARYAVIIYRVNGDTQYNDMLLTWDAYDETSTNCSQKVPVVKNTSKAANAQWQYAVIDLAYNLGSTEAERAAAAAKTKIRHIYLKSPLNYFKDNNYTNSNNPNDKGYTHNNVYYPPTGNSMDLAAVAYFPYYGDAEQFIHYGLTLGCQQKYYVEDNRAFDFRNATRVRRLNDKGKWGVSAGNQVDSAITWIKKNFGSQLFSVGTRADETAEFEPATVTFDPSGKNGVNTVNQIGYGLFGEESGLSMVGLLESKLDENGRPLYKEEAVAYLAMFLRDRLTKVKEYPADNYGWKNYSFVTGTSTTSEVDEAYFGKDSLGRSIDLSTALCNRVSGAKRGGGTANGTMGTYAASRAKAKELVGTWDDCKGNIETWFDAAYYLLHNLYVTKDDTAYDGDGYGEYEDDYRNMVLPMAHIKDTAGNITDAYFFDSDFAIRNADGTTETALIYDKTNRVLGMDLAANVTKDFAFLPTSGTGTETGETNSPYYVDNGGVAAGSGASYRKKDYLFSLTGNGFFIYEEDLFFEFEGDDDVYLFINGELVLDIGGTHPATRSKIQLDDYVDWAWSVKREITTYKGKKYTELSGADRARVDALALEKGAVCSFDFFYMERHGAGSNLRIVTNMEVTAEGLNVDKSAYQNGIEIAPNGIVDVDIPVEYGFKIVNDSDAKMYRLTFEDAVIGVSLDYKNGLTIDPEYAPFIKNAAGHSLTVPDLKIYVTDENNTDPIIVTCNDNEELKSFLTNMTSNDGTVSGDGLWLKASVQIRGIYYHMTEAQKGISSFRNYVSATADAGGVILRGADDHTVYQPGRPAYYQWVGKPVIIEREQLYHDLLDGVVAGETDLPALGNMILVPSDANGVERQDNGLVNTRGGDIYLRINYEIPRSYVAYVTILDQTNPNYRLTVPITVYVTDAEDSTMVLDYGLDSYLTDQEAIFDYELNLAVGDHVTGTVMGIADDDITPSYKPYHTDSIETAGGNTQNDLTLVNGSYANQVFTNARFRLDTPIYLEHRKPWVIEFSVKSLKYNTCLLSLYENRETDENTQLYLYKVGSAGYIAMGSYSTATGHNTGYGVQCSRMTWDSEWTAVKLFNVIDGNTGTNTIYCSVNGGTAVPMDHVFSDKTMQSTQDATGLSGKDFVFKYMGCKGSPDSYNLQLNMDYLRVYEEGKQLTHYRWEPKADENGQMDYVGVNTGKNGYTESMADYYAFGDYHRWRYFNVTLNSDRAWELEFEMKVPSLNKNFMLFSSTGSKTANLTEYIYVIPSKRFIAMGYDVDGASYTNYGVILPAKFDLTVKHTYLLKNRINADGSNMVYLYVDKDENGVWQEVGPLNYYSLGSSIGSQSNGLSGHDFNFKYIGGHDSFALTNQEVTYFEIHEDTALRTAYEWVAGANGFECKRATSDGNRIQFTEEETGIVEDGNAKFTLEGNRLKFETSSFLDRAYTAYIAMTIHDKNHTPTPLNQTGVNVAKEVQMYKKVSVIPANVVYYEDDFPAIHYVEGNENVITSIGNKTVDQLQTPDQKTEYGSDPFYQDDSSNSSGGHLHKIQVKQDSCLAWFGFRGTGFEMISATNAVDSALIYVEVYNRTDVTISNNTVTPKEGSAPLAWIPVIPEFDHQNNGGTEAIYQVPLIRWQREDNDATDLNEALNPGAYIVTINAYATYDFSNYDPSNPNQELPVMDTYVYIDGIRIFQPMGYEHDGYAPLENRVLFDEIRDQILDAKIMACEQTDAGLIMSSGTVTWTERYNGLDHNGRYYEGYKVNSVDDYLIKGPNNEVYMDGSKNKSSLAFVVYRNSQEQYKNRELGLQIGVRALDAGDFYGKESSGKKANLQLGVTDSNGGCSWMHLATVTGGTEQYITIPYTLCPATNQNGVLEYHVVVRVAPYETNASAMVSFSSLKRTEGLELKEGIGEAVTIRQDQTGQWVTSTGKTEGVVSFMLFRRAMVSDSVISYGDAIRGENFVNDAIIPESKPAIVPKYPALSFEEEVQYHVFYTVQNLGDVALGDMGLITFDTENKEGTLADAMDVIPGAVYHEGQYIVHTNGIPAKKLGDTLYFKVYAKLADGSYVYSNLYNYSAKVYAMNQLKGTNDAVKPLVVAMLNYGAAAQEFFGYRTDSLMNADLTADQRALVQSYHSDMATAVVPADANKIGAFASNGGFTRMRPSVTFGGAFSINYFFTPAYALDGALTMYYWDAETYNSVDQLTVENALGSKTMNLGEGGEYLAAYTDIAAKEIGDTVYVAAVYESGGVTYCTGVLPYSLSLYCKRFAENSSSNAQDLASATMVYGHYAEAFFRG